MLTREQLLTTFKRSSETVKVPELGGEIIIRGISAAELLSFQRSVQSKKNGAIAIDEDSFAAKLLVRCIVDASGKRVLTDTDWEPLMEWPAAAFQRCTTIAMRLNGYGSAEGNA
jgi:hypothetical protein